MRRKAVQDGYGFKCECTACKNNLTLTPSSVTNSLMKTWMSEIKKQGTPVIGVQTPQEIAALRAVAAWAKKVVAELNEIEMKAGIALFGETVNSGGYLPGPTSPFMKKEYFDIASPYFRSQNVFGLSEEFSNKYFVRTMMKLVEQTKNMAEYYAKNEDQFHEYFKLLGIVTPEE
ncbi:hypothetical protein ONS95_005933 [Cadophora gregata]|uniref:uncharacterized protein n=1 Tax=Cadophora gregata TaxID=51156 RepID=UPI0026DC860C|nr:uncharacterized protein ONS95_005933 [Cadophora gregata]KAK0102310.1 hypothetical protein ONS95_005933 [Cadophora gregata]KAK0103938.1 hypothetical protein ONS96_005045 [Cadophora gregata f. sp. sojae]